MSGSVGSLLKRSVVFTLGMILLLLSIYTVIMSAAYEIGVSPMYFDYQSYNWNTTFGKAIVGGIGSLLVFIGWHVE
jgi:hypothetical protein